MQDLKELEKKTTNLPEKAKEIVVKDDPTLNRANKALLYIKGIRKEINDACDPLIKKTHEAHKEAVAQKKRFEKPLVEAEKYIKQQIAGYVAEIDRKRLEAELEERKRQEAIRKEQLAIESTDKEELSDQEMPDFTPVATVSKPQLEGVSIRKDWRWEIVDPLKIPREYLTIDPIAISQEVNRSKEKTNIPGIRVFQKDTVSVRNKF